MELAIDYAIPDIRKFVRRVVVMKGMDVVSVIG